MRTIFFVWLTAATLASSCPNGKPCKQFQQPASPESREAAEFLARLKEAVAHNDTRRLISMAKFPVQYGAAPGGDFLYERDLTHRYNELFSEHVKSVLQRQQPDELYSDQPGRFAVGSGEIWFEKVGEPQEFRLTVLSLTKYYPAGFETMEENEEVEQFLADLQRYAAEKRADKLASMISFPISVRMGKTRTTIKSPKEFVANYARIFTAKVRHALACQQRGLMFVSSSGIRVGRGEVWFNQVLIDGRWEIKITSISN